MPRLGHGPAPHQNPQRRDDRLNHGLLGRRRDAVRVHDVGGDFIGQERPRSLPQPFQNEPGQLVPAEVFGRLVTLASRDALGVAGDQKHRRRIQVRQRGPELCQLPFGLLDLCRDLDPLGLNRGNDMGNGFAHAPNLGAGGLAFLGAFAP